MTFFLVAQPFRAAEESPAVGWAIVYVLRFQGVTMALSAGLKPRGYDERGASDLLNPKNILGQPPMEDVGVQQGFQKKRAEPPWGIPPGHFRGDEPDQQLQEVPQPPPPMGTSDKTLKPDTMP
jgi:hypothetical protein